MKTLYKLDGTPVINDLLQLNDIESGNKHIKLPDGTMIQIMSGQVAVGEVVPIAITVPFISIPVIIINGDWKSDIKLTNVYENSIFVKASNAFGESTCKYYLIAVGRWK